MHFLKFAILSAFGDCIWDKSSGMVDRQEDQWSRIEQLEMNLHTYGHLIFDKGAKTMQWGKKPKIFMQWCSFNGAVWLSACIRMQIDPFLSPCTKLKSKWIKGFHIKTDTLKLIEEKVGERSWNAWAQGKVPEQNTDGLYYNN